TGRPGKRSGKVRFTILAEKGAEQASVKSRLRPAITGKRLHDLDLGDPLQKACLLKRGPAAHLIAVTRAPFPPEQVGNRFKAFPCPPAQIDENWSTSGCQAGYGIRHLAGPDIGPVSAR